MTSHDPVTGRNVEGEVEQVFIHEDVDTLRLTTTAGEVITTTTHPFYVENRGWTPAGQLHEGDQLRPAEGTDEVVTVVSLQATGHKETVYNFTVTDWHNYHIHTQDDTGQTPVLVHNDGKTPGGCGPGQLEPPRFVYRGGSRTPQNLTPRPGIDTTGLSTFDTPEAAAPKGGWVQVIDTTKLELTEAIPDAPPPGHVSIRPKDGGSIEEWAATRASPTPSPYTLDIENALGERIKVPKP